MSNDLLKIAEANQQRAWEIIRELRIPEMWQQFGAKANLIGSLPTGLLMKNRDIDFHIYSGNFSIADSFGAMTEIAKNKRIKRITYDNLLDTQEMCIEWHAWYQDVDNNLWQIDMIHILNESPYAGRMEKVSQKINEVMTPEMRMAILTIKNDIPTGEKIMGIEIYRAVIRDKVKSFSEFTEWRKNNGQKGIIDWIP